jgi:hypothetical protein
MSEIDRQIADLLELLNAREEFDEIAELFGQSSQSWHQFTPEEKIRLAARVASNMSKGPVR